MTKKTLAAAEEKYRVALYRTLELLLPEAEKQARSKKPALLRILTRAAGRGPKALRSEDREDTKEGLNIDWAGTPYEDRIKKKKDGNDNATGDEAHGKQ